MQKLSFKRCDSPQPKQMQVTELVIPFLGIHVCFTFTFFVCQTIYFKYDLKNTPEKKMCISITNGNDLDD